MTNRENSRYGKSGAAKIKSTMPRSFLRWAGGKQRLLKQLVEFVPREYKRYFEPFFGAGSLFFALRPRDALLSDINSELMLCYRQVAKRPKLVYSMLQKYAKKNSSKFYYQVRQMNTHHISGPERAARFIYLNKAAFNGIYRVNTNGQFNVPYGPSGSGPAIPSSIVLEAAAKLLRRAKILTADFAIALRKAKKGDFVYLDPPYPPRSTTAYFTHYSSERFGWDQQLRVARVFKELSDRGCLVMLSNADQKKINTLYNGFFVTRINTVRWLGSNGDRFGVREVVITNYSPSNKI